MKPIFLIGAAIAGGAILYVKNKGGTQSGATGTVKPAMTPDKVNAVTKPVTVAQSPAARPPSAGSALGISGAGVGLAINGTKLFQSLFGKKTPADKSSDKPEDNSGPPDAVSAPSQPEDTSTTNPDAGELPDYIPDDYESADAPAEPVYQED